MKYQNFVYMLHEGLAIRAKHKSIKEHHAIIFYSLISLRCVMSLNVVLFHLGYRTVYVLLLVLSYHPNLTGPSVV